MDSSSDRVELRPGMDVFSIDGEKVGTVVDLDDVQITVEKGFIFHQDVAIPMSAVDSADDESIYLNLSKDDALNQRWTSGAETPDGTYAVSSVDDPAMGGGTTTGASGQDSLHIPVREEELTAIKRPVEAGQVHINTNVVSEDHTLEVPITEERVRVTRRAVDRLAPDNAGAFEGGTVTVPVQTEQVDVQKRVRVAEEVEVAKDAVQKTQRVGGAVRREVVDVTDNTDGSVIDPTKDSGAKGSGR